MRSTPPPAPNYGEMRSHLTEVGKGLIVSSDGVQHALKTLPQSIGLLLQALVKQKHVFCQNPPQICILST